MVLVQAGTSKRRLLANIQREIAQNKGELLWLPLLQLWGRLGLGASIVQAVRGFSVHFWKKIQFFPRMISNMYPSDPDIAQSILTS